jgi:hypothetical protein
MTGCRLHTSYSLQLIDEAHTIAEAVQRDAGCAQSRLGDAGSRC